MINFHLIVTIICLVGMAVLAGFELWLIHANKQRVLKRHKLWMNTLFVGLFVVGLVASLWL